MKKITTSFLASIMVLSMVMSLFIPVSAEKITAVNKFNVVFVVDSSGSMKTTDPEGWRYDAINEFLGLLSECGSTGNYVGAVTFSDIINNKSAVKEVMTKSQKTSVLSSIKSVEPSGWTNIGSALVCANELLEKNGNPELESIIILLSDGNSEMKSVGEYSDSITQREVAISEAQVNERRIFCIGLNADGKIKRDELEHIAEKTGGTVEIVSKASDLKNVFESFYKLIYNTTGMDMSGNFDASGSFEQPFSVPKIGVEEVNIIINGSVDTILLKRPTGDYVTTSELYNMLTKGTGFILVKITEPLSGIWNLKLTGLAKNTVKINFIPNLNIALVSQNCEESYKKGSTVPISTKIYSKETVVTDKSVYSDYVCTYKITNARNPEDSRTVTAREFDGEYRADVIFDDFGFYYVTPSIDIGYGDVIGDPVNVNIGNVAPVPIKDVVHISGYVLLFEKRSFDYNLNEYASDADGDELSFEVAGSTGSNNVYQISDSIITITPQKIGAETVKIIATDIHGASCEFYLNLKYKNMLTYILLLCAIILLLVLMVVVVLCLKKANKKFHGTITVTAFDSENGDYSSPMTELPGKGSMDIESINNFAWSTGGIKGKFLASGKDYITFKPKGVVFSSDNRVKSIKISDGCTETINSAKDRVKGIEVTFNYQINDF